MLIVCSGNARNFSFERNQAFIYDQVEAIRKNDLSIEFGYFFIKGRGAFGYLRNLRYLRREISIGSYDFVHAHGGDSVLLACLQRKISVIGTFHGSDLNKFPNRLFSNIANILSQESIVVSKKLYKKLWHTSHVSVVPCGVNFDLFYPSDKQEARRNLKISNDKKVVIFSSAFTNPVKNYGLAKAAIELLNDVNIIVLELKGCGREQVRHLLNAADVSLMTSFSEGSPQFIKEAMACNIPIVSTDVGDVKDNIATTQGCYIVSFEPEDVAKKIQNALTFKQRTNGREVISFLDNDIIAKKIISMYKKMGKSSN